MSNDGRSVAVVLKVEYVRRRDLMHDYITDLGAGGIFVQTDLPFERGQEIAFSLSFPGLLRPMEFLGKVRWRRPVGAPGGPGIAVEFISSDDQHRHRLDALLKRLQLEEAVETASPRPGQRFAVLLVEDNELVQELFQYAIRRYHVGSSRSSALSLFSARTVKEARALLERETFDLAIVDHFLPDARGCDLVTTIRQDPRHAALPVLVVSVGHDVRQQALEVGADFFLGKPVMRRHLVQTLERLLATRSYGAC